MSATPGVDPAIFRRLVTGDDADGRSVLIVDGPPSTMSGDFEIGGLFDIWHDAVSGVLDPKTHEDLGPSSARLSPDSGKVKVRWFMVHPVPGDVPREQINAATRQRFADFGAEDHLTDQSIHPAMHRTETLDVICLLQGEASLVLDAGETPIRPGQIVIQRGTSHAWRAHGGPALFLAVLIDRPAPEAAKS
ncbi:MAG: cupin domain-containing protein [Hyphomonadaceae bacterium]